MLHKRFAEEDCQLPGKALVFPQDHIQDHEEAIDGACVFKVDFHVQGGAWQGFASCLNGEDATPR